MKETYHILQFRARRCAVAVLSMSLSAQLLRPAVMASR
jgi:hypothetical protein